MWRRGGAEGFGSSNHSLPLDTPFGYPIQHGQFLIRHFPRFSCYSRICVLSPPERSFLAYAFPLLDMCKPRLSYPVSIFLSHICSVQPHVLLSLSLMITTSTITSFYLFSFISEKEKQNTKMHSYLHKLPFLSCPVFCV